jgi:hypothetical protein
LDAKGPWLKDLVDVAARGEYVRDTAQLMHAASRSHVSSIQIRVHQDSPGPVFG